MRTLVLVLTFAMFSTVAYTQKSDSFVTAKGNRLTITHIGHGTLMLSYQDKIIHIDPWSSLANYDTLPKADYVLLTHHHRDHLDSVALTKVCTPNTQLYWTDICASQTKFKADGKVVANGDTIVTPHFRFIAVPAYNIVNKRSNGEPFHPKGEGNGYIFEFDNLRVYVAGDTENIPEMENLGPIDIVFLPANLPFTMSPEMFKAAVLMVKPKILYPYHTGNTNLEELAKSLDDLIGVELRLRNLK
jgi:L-ascorbate metabolism protein UlaG (beta-lactamase superfamily)